ncbi:Gfo/Idh/MocA family protein [Humibacter sp. RRB41]|uniref:Gfo/Idh/MocA family protein n=1 Tax=Humibacter sp. RRB41 TaxID=2919946 RepID=UPI001FAAC779|nr:Gfo/Idh/MocA family oxidoreductase [Humibacter sp. RRB41]
MTASTVGLVGAGGIAQVHLPGWLDLGFDVVVHSIDGKARELTDRFGGRAVDSMDELLDAAQIVDVVTPTDTHRLIVERAAAAGKHVVCEKPLALTVADSAAMIAACSRAGVRLFPAHVVRYFHAYTAMQAAVAAGRVGTPAAQRFYRIGSAPKQPWFRDRARSGGLAMDQLIHDFDQARFSAGEVETVYATRTGDEGAGPTTVQAILRHRSGTITHVNGVWGRPGLGFRYGFTVVGPDGLLEHDSLRYPVLQYDGLADADKGYLPPVDPASSPYTAELADFARAIRDGSPARVSAEDALEAVRIATAVNRSIDEHTEIALDTAPSLHAGDDREGER